MRKACIPILLVAIVVPQNAFAQQQSGETGALADRTSPKANITGDTAAAARQATVEIGECIVKRNIRAAKEAVALPMDHPRLREILTRLANNRCLSAGQIGIPPLLLRSALFEALYAAEFGPDFAVDLSKVPVIDYAAPYTRPFSQGVLTGLAAIYVGDCLARSNSSAARLMVNTRPGSPSENRATGAFAQKLPSCVPQGQTIKFSRSFIRGAVAEAVYRLSEKARSSSPMQAAN